MNGLSPDPTQTRLYDALLVRARILWMVQLEGNQREMTFGCVFINDGLLSNIFRIGYLPAVVCQHGISVNKV